MAVPSRAILHRTATDWEAAHDPRRRPTVPARFPNLWGRTEAWDVWMWHNCDLTPCRLEVRLRGLSGRIAETPGGPGSDPQRTWSTYTNHDGRGILEPAERRGMAR
jgi:hypothetical protein